MRDKKLFSVVIVTYQRPDQLEACLRRVAPSSQNLSSENYEIIVSDDSDNSKLLQSKFPTVVWTNGPGKGPAANRNHGASKATGEFIVFLDDDCLPDIGWLKAFSDAIIANPNVNVFEGRIYADRTRISLAEVAPLNETGGFLWSANLAIRSALFKNMHGFEESFPYPAMEDVELRTRLNKKLEKYIFVKEAAVCHPWKARGGWQRCKQHRDSMMTFLTLHPEERVKHSPKFFLIMAMRGLLKEMLPGLLSYRGRGLKQALIEYFSNFLMAIRVISITDSDFRKKL